MKLKLKKIELVVVILSLLSILYFYFLWNKQQQVTKDQEVYCVSISYETPPKIKYLVLNGEKTDINIINYILI